MMAYLTTMLTPVESRRTADQPQRGQGWSSDASMTPRFSSNVRLQLGQ